MNITIVGAGRWGSSLAWYLSKIKGFNVVLYGRESEKTKLFFHTRSNDYVTLPANVETTFDLGYSLSNEYIIISLPTQSLRTFLNQLSEIPNYKNHKYITCMKGLELETGKRISEVFNEFDISNNQIATWVGPCHVQNLQQGIKTTMVIDSVNGELSLKLSNLFKSDLLNIEQGSDFIGSELGSATKNIVGIGAGLLIGNNQEKLIPELKKHALAEVSSLIKASGGNPNSAYGICHYGDYTATVDSPLSHNRQLGIELAKNISHNSKNLSEGLYTIEALKCFLKCHNQDLKNYPLMNEIYNATHNLPYNIEKVLKNPLKIC